MSAFTIEIANPLTQEVFQGTNGVSLRMDEHIAFNYLYTSDNKHVVEVTKLVFPTAVLTHFISIDEVIAFLGTFKHLYIMTPDAEEHLKNLVDYRVFDISTGDNIEGVSPFFLPYESKSTHKFDTDFVETKLKLSQMVNNSMGLGLSFDEAKLAELKKETLNPLSLKELTRSSLSGVVSFDTETVFPNQPYDASPFVTFAVNDINMTMRMYKEGLFGKVEPENKS